MTTALPLDRRPALAFFAALGLGCTLVLIAATPRAAHGQQQPILLTLGGAARLAADKSAGPEEARYRAEQADARVRQSKAALLPDVSGALSEGERTFNSASFGINFADPATGKYLFDPNGQVLGPVKTYDLRGTIRQNIYDPSSYAKLKAARANAAAYGDDASAQSQQAAAMAATVYVRALRADAQLAARVADSTLDEDLLGIARDQLAAGVGITLDVTRAQSQLAQTRAQLISARNDRDRAQLDLRRALGLPLSTPITLADTLLALPTTGAVPTAEEATARAMKTRADLRTADAQIAAAERQIESVKSERLPALSAFIDNGPDGKDPTHMIATYDWGIQLSVPMFDGFRREGRIEEQKAAVQELGVRKRDLVEQASIDVSGALLDLASARESLAATEEHLRLAEQELEQARDRFRSGVSGNADVITASLSLNAARTQTVDARAAFQSARVALAHAQGTTTELP
jgi:outer membrane protein TolC